jgi:AraC family transcriptional regulator
MSNNEALNAHASPTAASETFQPPGFAPAAAGARTDPESARPRSGLAPHRLQRVLACVESRLAEPIQVKELADEIHMSPFHFARMFKLSTGHAPHAYITRQRMDRARSLLATTQLPLQEVAARVGYQTQAHFTGVFHRYVGTTPRVYRLQQRGSAAAG